jgi:hypothetical protein
MRCEVLLMPDGRKIIVGDAFRLPLRDINYWRDIFLLIPFLLFAVTGIFKLLNHQWVVGSESIGIAFCALLFARERFLLVLGAVGFCALRFVIVIALTQDWRGYVGLLVAIVLLLLFGRFTKSYKPSYGWPEGSIAELIVGLSSRLLALKVFTLIDR